MRKAVFRFGPPHTHTHSNPQEQWLWLIHPWGNYTGLICYNQLIDLPIKNHRRLSKYREMWWKSKSRSNFSYNPKNITDWHLKQVPRFANVIMPYNMQHVQKYFINFTFVKYTISSSSSCIHTPCNIYSKLNLLSRVSSLSVLIINNLFNYLTNNCTNKEMLTW